MQYYSPVYDTAFDLTLAHSKRQNTATLQHYNSLAFQDDKIKSAFNYFDKGKRGSITVKDLSAVFGTVEQAKEIMKDVDVDGDGTISYQEFHSLILKEDSYKASSVGEPIR